MGQFKTIRDASGLARRSGGFCEQGERGVGIRSECGGSEGEQKYK